MKGEKAFLYTSRTWWQGKVQTCQSSLKKGQIGTLAKHMEVWDRRFERGVERNTWFFFPSLSLSGVQSACGAVRTGSHVAR